MSKRRKEVYALQRLALYAELKLRRMGEELRLGPRHSELVAAIRRVEPGLHHGKLKAEVISDFVTTSDLLTYRKLLSTRRSKGNLNSSFG